MYINKLKLNNYRNYNSLDLVFDSKINILYGENAAGKTNILESIYMLATTKSHKNIKENELINFDKNEAHIQAELNIKNEDKIIDIHLKKSRKKGVAIDKHTITKITDFIGLVNVVIFSPEDLKLIKEGPSQRRKYIDFYIMQVDKIYTHHLISYNKILNQRNKLLKQLSFERNRSNSLLSTLDAWDEELVKHGKEIIKKREEVINEIKPLIEKKSYYISDKKEKLEIEYEKNIDVDSFVDELKKERDRDIRYQLTTVGPHRDDIKFTENNIDIRKFGSQGQQKTAAICLKLTEIEKIIEKTNDHPILLLDDVFSELDETRQKLLIDNISDTQTIITATGIKDNIFNLLKPNKVFNIKNNGSECI